jgi:hypothetical protein
MRLGSMRTEWSLNKSHFQVVDEALPDMRLCSTSPPPGQSASCRSLKPPPSFLLRSSPSDNITSHARDSIVKMSFSGRRVSILRQSPLNPGATQDPSRRFSTSKDPSSNGRAPSLRKYLMQHLTLYREKLTCPRQISISPSAQASCWPRHK